VHAKLREIRHDDFTNLGAIESELLGNDACFFCLGVSSLGMSEAEYSKITYDATLAVAAVLARCEPPPVFIYVSGMGTDSSERGGVMWARVKGRTENALLKLPFRAAYMFRPGVIQPLHGIRSKTALYQTLYTLLGPVLPAIRALLPNQITTTEQVGKAMLEAVRRRPAQRYFENRDINALAAA
jgi:uncharacterized protein YbjT (DUF2867 family)